MGESHVPGRGRRHSSRRNHGAGQSTKHAWSADPASTLSVAAWQPRRRLVLEAVDGGLPLTSQNQPPAQ